LHRLPSHNLVSVTSVFLNKVLYRLGEGEGRYEMSYWYLIHMVIILLHDSVVPHSKTLKGISVRLWIEQSDVTV